MGEQLEEVAPGLWTLTRPLRFWGVEVGGRMTVVRLRDGGLFVHSPLPLAPVREEIEALGPVRAVVAPSLFHHMSVPEWREAFPTAFVGCCPGLERKRDDVPWDAVLSDEPSELWEGELRQVFFGARTMENEVVFFHVSSGTMITCDALFHLSEHEDGLTRVVAALLANRGPSATWLERLMIRDRRGAREQIDRMLAWEPERILLAHGPPVTRDGAAALGRAYAWL